MYIQVYHRTPNLAGRDTTEPVTIEFHTPLASGVIAAIAAILFVFVAIMIFAAVMAVAVGITRQSHSQKKRKSVFPSHSGTFTAMTSVCVRMT